MNNAAVPQWVIVVVFTLIACAGIYGAITDLGTGVIRSKGWTFHREQCSVLFWIIHVCRVGVIAFAILTVLHAIGAL
jgi:hypothetical protein